MDQDQEQDTLGRYLRRKRESLLIPVQEIAQATDTPKTIIQALEEDDYNVFSQRPQAQTSLKRVAAYLKLNESDVLPLFDREWMQYSQKKEFPKLSSFADTPLSCKTSLPSRGATATITGRALKMPNLSETLKRFRLPKTRIRLPIIITILLIGLLLLIDLPFSKQKPPPPPDPRFIDTQKKPMPVATGHALPPLDSTDRAEDVPQDTPPPRQANPPSLAVREKHPTVQKSGLVIGNSDSKRYHLAGMKYYDKIKAYHRVVFHSEKEAVDAGYRKARE